MDAERRAGCRSYVTPKVAVGAIVGNDKGELLLIQRGDSGVWLYPTGWADVGYSASEVVVKEVEETGIVAEPVRLVAVFDGLRLGRGGFPSTRWCSTAARPEVSCRRTPSNARCGMVRGIALPEPLAGGGRWVELAFAAIKGQHIEVVFDWPRSSTWRS